MCLSNVYLCILNFCQKNWSIYYVSDIILVHVLLSSYTTFRGKKNIHEWIIELVFQKYAGQAPWTSLPRSKTGFWCFWCSVIRWTFYMSSKNLEPCIQRLSKWPRKCYKIRIQKQHDLGCHRFRSEGASCFFRPHFIRIQPLRWPLQQALRAHPNHLWLGFKFCSKGWGELQGFQGGSESCGERLFHLFSLETVVPSPRGLFETR